MTRLVDFSFFDVGYAAAARHAGARSAAADREPARSSASLSPRSFKIVLSASLPAAPDDIRDHHGGHRPRAAGDTRQSLLRRIAWPSSARCRSATWSAPARRSVSWSSSPGERSRCARWKATRSSSRTALASRERLEVFRRGGPPMARILNVDLEYDAPAFQGARRPGGGGSRPAGTRARSRLRGSYFTDSPTRRSTYELRYWLEDYARYLDVDSARPRACLVPRSSARRLRLRLSRHPPAPVRRRTADPDGPRRARSRRPSRRARSSRRSRRPNASSSARERALFALPQGETVVREGDATSSMFLIASGRAAVSVTGDSAGSQKVALLEAGHRLRRDQPADRRAAHRDRARDRPSPTLVEIDKATLAPILRANPSLVEKLDAIILERRRHTAGWLGQVRSGVESEPESLRGRIARFFGLKGLA